MNSVWIITTLGVLLFLSVSTNIFLIWYLWRLLKHVSFYEIELAEMIGSIKNFTNHLSTVYEMDLFYGDETLHYLLQHARDLTDVFDHYESDIPQEMEEEPTNEATTQE